MNLIQRNHTYSLVVLDPSQSSEFNDFKRTYWLMTIDLHFRGFFNVRTIPATVLVNATQTFPPHSLLLTALTKEKKLGIRYKKNGALNVNVTYSMIKELSRLQYLEFMAADKKTQSASEQTALQL